MYMPLRSRMCSSASSVLIDFSSYATLARAMRVLTPAAQGERCCEWRHQSLALASRRGAVQDGP